MPLLDGTERAVPWAVRCHHQLLTAAYTMLVVEGELTEEEWESLENEARRIARRMVARPAQRRPRRPSRTPASRHL
ncbi:hypothetical protein ACSCBZ_22345 [Streptomyces niveiscabiei]|uniref:hypothetical protein n=1 Tax=Streptomyces niveiscabiei TaxID=164115 RepID=UPI000A72DE6A